MHFSAIAHDDMIAKSSTEGEKVMPRLATTIADAEKRGNKEGRNELGKQVLDYLEHKYLARDVERSTPYSKEILDLTRELGKLIRGEIG